MLLLEPKGHVQAAELDRTLLLAVEALYRYLTVQESAERAEYALGKIE